MGQRKKEIDAVESHAIHLGVSGQVQHGLQVDGRLGVGTLADQSGPHGVVERRVRIAGHLYFLAVYLNNNRSFLASILAASIPGTFFRSSMDLKLPCLVRY